MAEINKTAPGVWLVNLTGPALASLPSTHAVYRYDNGNWRCNCGAPDCAHIKAVIGQEMGRFIPAARDTENNPDWGLASEAKSSPVDTALAGFYDLLRHYYEPDDAERVITIPEFDSSLRAILEALVEDAERNVGLTRKVR